MTKTENRKKTTAIGMKPVGAGTFLGVIVAALVLFVGAVLISGEKVPESFRGVIVPVSALLGAFIGGLFAAKKNKGSFVFTGMIVGSVLFCIRMIASAFSADGSFFDISTVSMLIFLLAGGFFGGLMAGKKRHKRKK